jgi:hypothetical protein
MRFGAPWGRLLRISSIAVTVLMVSVAAIGQKALPRHLLVSRSLTFGLPLLVLVGAAPFVVLGYRLEGHKLIVQRGGWNTEIPLRGLISAQADPEAMRSSIRLFGNGGLYVIAGWFWNKKLGRFRAYANDPNRAVVLRLIDRTIVVTPDEPDRFVAALHALTGTVSPEPGTKTS